MKKHIQILSVVMTLVMLAGIFSGCVTGGDEGEEPIPEVSSPANESPHHAADDVFTLNCNKEYNFNPITATNADNLLCTQLMYENIFEVDATFTASSDIITEYSTNDGVYWVFKVDTSIKFWDGSTLTATDVAYSIQRAQQSPRLRSRLRSIGGASAQDEETFVINLYAANMQLPSLLTVPIIKYESIEEVTPLGTGPYKPNNSLTELRLHSGHRRADEMPFDVVYLKEVTRIDDAISAYENSEIDLVTNDPTGLLNLGYGSANDARYYPTTNMHYIGFNGNSFFFSNALVRKAMTYVINREDIVNSIMGGAAVEASMPMNPASPLYNANYSKLISYSVKKSEEAFDEAEVQDYDDDDYREIMINGIPVETNITFIVANDNAQKVAAAQSITDNLIELGIKVELKVLAWEAYTAALSAGNFDMYYAETMMTADFNPSELVLSGKSLNYGKFSSSLTEEKIRDYLSADDEGRKKAADLMNSHLAETAPIVAICFERHQVITHRGVIADLKPSTYNIFQNIHEWKVDLG